jgi:hypothetical protein
MLHRHPTHDQAGEEEVAMALIDLNFETMPDGRAILRRLALGGQDDPLLCIVREGCLLKIFKVVE